MTVAEADPQAQWDREYEVEFAAKVRRLAGLVSDRRREEDAARKAARGAKKRWKNAQEELEQHLSAADPAAAHGWHRRLRELAAAEDEAGLARSEARQKLRQAAERRGLAQDELRAAIRADRQPLPLFDHARRPEPEPERYPEHIPPLPEEAPVGRKRKAKPSAPEAPPGPTLEGEPIAGLGLSAAQLDAARVDALGVGGPRGKPLPVKPVTLSGRPWVCWQRAESADGSRQWALLPLYTPDEYAQRVGLGANEPLPGIFVPPDPYHFEGVTVSVSRGAPGLRVIGPRGEGRTVCLNAQEA